MRNSSQKSVISSQKLKLRPPHLCCLLSTDSCLLSSRPGLTLLEVLIAIFVMAVGLMGLAALIPVGRHDVLEGSKADRANACGRAAFRDVKVRGLLKPDSTAANFKLLVGQQNQVPFGTRSVCIDPLVIARAGLVPGAGTVPALWYFPAPLNTDTGDTTRNFAPPRMDRVTVVAWPGSPGYLGYQAAERIFTCQDDVQFALNNDETKRPNPVWSDNRLQPKGDYSWIATAVPISGTQFIVSVAVFYKRNTAVDSSFATAVAGNDATDLNDFAAERTVFAEFLSGGIGVGGGDVRLRLPDANASLGSSPDESHFTPVRPNTWLLLSGTTNTTPPSTFYGWYRVISVSQRADEQKGPELAQVQKGPGGGNQFEWYVDVTLDGSDLDPSVYQDADGYQVVYTNPNFTGTDPGTIYATLFENVVGVYTKTIEADTWAGWE